VGVQRHRRIIFNASFLGFRGHVQAHLLVPVVLDDVELTRNQEFNKFFQLLKLIGWWKYNSLSAKNRKAFFLTYICAVNRLGGWKQGCVEPCLAPLDHLNVAFSVHVELEVFFTAWKHTLLKLVLTCRVACLIVIDRILRMVNTASTLIKRVVLGARHAEEWWLGQRQHFEVDLEPADPLLVTQELEQLKFVKSCRFCRF